MINQKDFLLYIKNKQLTISYIVIALFFIKTHAYSQRNSEDTGAVRSLTGKDLNFENLSNKEYVLKFSGDKVAEITIDKQTPKSVGTIGSSFDVEKSMGFIKLRAILELRGIEGESVAGIYLKAIDRQKKVVAFNNLEDWKFKPHQKNVIAIEVPFDRRISSVSWGAYVSGTGSLNVKNLSLQISDKEFDEDGIDEELDSIDVKSVRTKFLANFGKVMGFLKYHHPSFNRGKVDWDSLVVAKLVNVVAAKNAKDYNVVLTDIFKRIGGVEKCDTCMKKVPDSLLINYNVDFIKEGVLSMANQRMLFFIRDNYLPITGHYVASAKRGTPNPEFNEHPYRQMNLPNLKYRLLTLYRYWNVINYFNPYRYAIGADWDAELMRLIPIFVRAKTQFDYHDAVLLMNASINDSHSSSVSGIDSYFLPSVVFKKIVDDGRPLVILPLNVKRIGRETFVYDIDSLFSVRSGLRKGDVLESIGQINMDTLAMLYHQYIGGSNAAYKDLVISRNNYLALTKLESNNNVAVRFQRDGASREISTDYIQNDYLDFFRGSFKAKTNGNPTCFKKLSDSILYVDPSKFDSLAYRQISKEVDNYNGIIIDFRIYPKYAIGRLLLLLSSKVMPSVKFQWIDLTQPGKMQMPDVQSAPGIPRAFKGKVVVLIDENSLSQSEFWAMQFKDCSPNSLAIGRTTAGADGEISSLVLPGALKVFFSGIRVNYADGRETQRIGIIPDIKVDHDIDAEIRKRDLILESAISLIK